MDASKSFACDICGKLFKDKIHVTSHMRIHTGEKPFACDVCDRTFTHKNTLVNHKRIHTGEKLYECEFCKKSFCQLSTLVEHKRKHTGEKPFACEICNKAFYSSSDLTKHKRVHTGEKPYSCDVCQKLYTTSSALSRHNKSAAHIERMKSRNTNIPLNKSSLVDCGESIKEENIKEDILEEESSDGPLSMNYFTECGAKREIKKEINGSDEGQEHLCGKSIKEESINEDIKEEESSDGPLSMSYFTESGAKQGIKEEVNGSDEGQEHLCKVCGKSCLSKSHLIVHERIHTGEKPFACDVCDRTFTHKNTLVNHKRIHTGEKLYECDICKKTFCQLSTLVEHKRKHTGEKPYKCELCNKAFYSSSDLTKHKRVHTGEKPYSCDVCQKLYTTSSSLSKHNKTAGHLERMKSRNTNIPYTHYSLVDCGESIKEEDIIEEESVDGPLSMNYITESGAKQEIKKEVNISNEGQGVDNFGLDTDNLIDCNEYLQVQMNLSK